MTTSIKPILRKNKTRSDGKAPLYIRVTKNRKTSFRSVGIFVAPQHWDESALRIKKGHPNAARANHALFDLLAKLNDELLGHAVQGVALAPKRLFEAIEPKAEEPVPMLLEYSRAFLDHVEKSATVGTYRRYQTVVTKVANYLKGRDIPMEHVTVAWLMQYERYLRTRFNNHTNTIAANMKILRRILNTALAEDLIDRTPFPRYSIKHEQTEIDYMTEEELRAFMELDLKEGSVMKKHRDVYVFACYAGGLRFGDLARLQWKGYDGTRIMLVMKKTRDPLSIKLSPTAVSILESFEPVGDPNELIFQLIPEDRDRTNLVSMHNAVGAANTLANKNLKILARRAGIDKRITFHTSRHTWATRALQKGMAIQHVSKILGHRSIKMTERYLKIANPDLDRAMDVFD